MFAKCANPACPRAFEYHEGGTYFRFTRRNSSTHTETDPEATEEHHHPVEHYWLCERCAEIYTLVFMEGAGVLLRPQWNEMESAEILKQLVSA